MVSSGLNLKKVERWRALVSRMKKGERDVNTWVDRYLVSGEGIEATVESGRKTRVQPLKYLITATQHPGAFDDKMSVSYTNIVLAYKFRYFTCSLLS